MVEFTLAANPTAGVIAEAIFSMSMAVFWPVSGSSPDLHALLKMLPHHLAFVLRSGDGEYFFEKHVQF